jgi:tetratricopeptide (TPR) repeat protein
LANYLTPQVVTRADLAAVYGGLGAIEQGLETARQALTVAETCMPILRPYVLAKLAPFYLRQDHLSEAGAAIDQAKTDPNGEVYPLYLQAVIGAEAELALRQGDYERALALTNDVLANFHQYGMRAYIPETLYLRARILSAMGQTEAARKTLLEAHTEAEAIGSRRMLWQILFALSQLETDPAKTNQLRQQAQEIVESIAGNIGDPELRTSFLNLAEVPEVLPV